MFIRSMIISFFVTLIVLGACEVFASPCEDSGEEFVCPPAPTLEAEDPKEEIGTLTLISPISKL